MNLPTKIAKAPSGDFIGFSFAGVHSSDLGICRTSDGNRYNDTFLPTIQDKTIQVPGGDGTYYFGSYFTQKPFSIPIAFDCMTEVQYQYFKELFGDKKIHPLVFDDHPYKTYYVKVTGSPQLKFICFDEEIDDSETVVQNLYNPGELKTGNKRIYKGEGILSFTAYYPYAESQDNYIEDYILAEWSNYEEWQEASKLPYSRVFTIDMDGNEGYLQTVHINQNPSITEESALIVYAYNKTSPIQWKARFPIFSSNQNLTIECKHYYTGDYSMELGDSVGTLKLENLSSLISDNEIGDTIMIEIDTEKRLVKKIQISNDTEKTEICNYKITEGDFFTIPNEGYYVFIVTGYEDLWNDFTSEYEQNCFLNYKYRYL